MKVKLLTVLKSILRFSLNSFRDYFLAKRGERKIRQIKQSNPLKIEFGASGKREGWVTIGLDSNSDIIYDIRNGIPFAENSIDEIYTSHLIEHLEYKEIIHFLTQCLRFLKSGGNIKICVPDTSIYMAMANDNNEFIRRMEENLREGSRSFGELIEKTNPFFKYHSSLSILNYIAYMNGQHKYMFDKTELISILKHVGFSMVKEEDFDPVIDLEIRKWESLHIIAIK